MTKQKTNLSVIEILAQNLHGNVVRVCAHHALKTVFETQKVISEKPFLLTLNNVPKLDDFGGIFQFRGTFS